MSYLGEHFKKLGFGLMRLPRLDDSTIDLEQVKQMVDLFLSKGFTYFDTAWAYPGSEDAIRQALVERYPRDKFTIATKNAAWINCKTRDDAIAQFETSLKQTGAGYFDFYLLHNLGEMRTHFFDDFKMWDFVADKKREGLIKHYGFSFHSTPEELDDILTKHPDAEFVQLQINWADWENPAIQSRGCYEVARKHGKPIVIMEPIKGGTLTNLPDEVAKVFTDANPDASTASWAIRFAASLDGIIAVLSGMSTLDQMKDNVSYMENFQRLTADEQAIVERARAELDKVPVIPCSSCRYCEHDACKHNIGISGSFTAMNILTRYKNKAFADGQYTWLVERHGKEYAGKCVKCGACERVCPQHISIRKELAKVAAAFGR